MLLNGIMFKGLEDESSRVTWSLRRGIGCTIVLLPCSKARKNFEVIEYLVLCIIVRSLHSRHWTIKLSLSSFYKSFTRDRTYSTL